MTALLTGLDPAAVGLSCVPPSLWWRVYPKRFGATEFNASGNGNARFSPIRDISDGEGEGPVVPTLYMGSSPAVALTESVLHDLPWPSDGFILTLPAPAEEARRMACLVNTQPLRLADFTSLGLHRLGLKKTKVVESDKTHYHASREIAEWVYAKRPDLQGIVWSSRQDDRGQAVLLFGTRVPTASLCTWHEGENVASGYVLEQLVELLDALGAGLLVGPP